jgi:nitrogen-specific signal transduction histidine kinase/FixJ family two-component response regulator
MKIPLLIVDDEKYVLSSLTRLFHDREKYEVHTAANEQEALEILEQHPIGVMICDQKLGSQSGTEFLKKTRGKWPDISRILLTAFYNFQMAEDLVSNAGVYRFISKPWNDDDLISSVENSWKRYQLIKQNQELLKQIQTENFHFKERAQNLKQKIEERITKTTESKKAIEAKKIQLEITYALLKGLSRSKNLNEIFKIILKELKKLIAFDDANIVVQLNREHYELISKERGMRIPAEGLQSAQNFFDNPKAIITDKSPFEFLRDSRASQDDAGSHIIFPLNGMAFLHFAQKAGSKRKNAFTEKDIHQLKEVANPITIAIEKIKLLEIVEQGSREWESTFDAISDLVTVIDENFTLIKANRATEKITHQRVEKVIGKKCYEVLANRKTPCRNCPAVESFKNKSITTEKEIIDFKDRDYLSWSYPVDNSMVIYYRDQTQASHLFRQLIQSEKMAAIGHLANSLAHELNNPLTGITAFSQILKKELGEDHKFYPDILEIEKASLRCKHIIENLLHFSENTSHQKRNSLSVNALIESTLPLIQYSASAKQNFRIEKKLEPEIPGIRGNPNELQQVFLNLLLNAIQAMPHGGKISLQTKFLPHESAVQITVSDTGVGIPKQNLSKIFDPFFTTKEKTSGTGLGLSVSYGIIRNHKGTIEVESRLKKGSTFKVFLPVE